MCYLAQTPQPLYTFQPESALSFSVFLFLNKAFAVK